MSILMDENGFAHRTLTNDDAAWCAEPLGDFLGCVVRVETVARACAPDYPTVDHYSVLFIPAQHHAAARIWLAGWSRGTADGVDSFQRRPRRPTTREFLVAEAFIESVPAFIARTVGGAS
jgi:hypothetical protein